MKKFYATLTLVLTLSVTSLFGQEPFFDLFVLSGDYSALVLPNSLSQGIPYDDPDYTVPIGFDFDYLGNTYQTLTFNGYDAYGCELLFTSDDLSIMPSQISPFMMDIIDGQFDAEGKADSDIRYVVEGVEGSRIFKLEWSNVAFYNEGEPYSMRINLQMWLYEQDNAIEFHYGAQENLDYDVIFDYDGVPITFVRNLDMNDYSFQEMWTLSGDVANPVWVDYTSFNNFDAGVHLNAAPANGVIYRFFPLLVNVEEKNRAAFNVYPNPCEDQISVNGEWSAGSIYKIFDMTGRVVSTGQLSTGVTQIAVNHLSSATYIIEVSDKNEVSRSRFNVK